MALTVSVNKICDVAERGTERIGLFSISITDYQAGGTSMSGLFTGFENPKAVIGSFANKVAHYVPSTKLLFVYEAGTASANLDELDNDDDPGTGYFLVIGN